MRAALKKIHRLEGLGDLGPGLVSGAINRFKEIDDEKKNNPPKPEWPTYKSGELGSFRRGLQTLPLAVAEYLTPSRVATSYTLTKLEKAEGKRSEYHGDSNRLSLTPSLRSSTNRRPLPRHV